MLLLLDNYDSFTYNLAQYLIELGQDVKVYRNDQISIGEVKRLDPEHIVISPGPKTPSEAGISMGLVRAFNGKIPILGVCLGHQSIAAALGATIVKARLLMHGKTSPILHDGEGVYKGIKSPFDATRYHSLIVEEDSLPKALEITSRTPEGEIMGIRHKSAPTEGVQFHPESIICQNGKDLLKNFLTF
ncbi:MAG TPA: aminodeoxychorismate/anthranilate synthase component II [Nitrospinota bacterium]|nr:aminodeoxychorismate/anthranilate synthase component II [Nitrospinota bacterium]|tara:strand:- start:118604 stop:119167 length:564 start_codon:yes stop_codon:yes gene_type:complete